METGPVGAAGWAADGTGGAPLQGFAVSHLMVDVFGTGIWQQRQRQSLPDLSAPVFGRSARHTHRNHGLAATQQLEQHMSNP